MRTMIVILLFLFTAALHAQEAHSTSDASVRYWGDVGVGGGEFFGGIAGVAFQPGPSNLFIPRGAYMEEFRICIFGPCTTPLEYRAEIAGMFGQIHKERWWSASAAAGIAATFVRIDESGQGNDPVAHTTIGLPIDLQAFFTPFSFLGIGVTCTANINPKKTFAGAFLTLQAGVLQ